MRFSTSFTCITLLLGAFGTGGVNAQSPSLYGPTLGFVQDAAGTLIRPILGVPGASALGDPLALYISIRNAVISPKQDYAIAVRNEDSRTVVIDLETVPPEINSVDAIHTGADVVTVSQMGSAAAFYDRETRVIQVIGGLPHAPQLVGEYASQISGTLAGMALSDDGTIALARFVDPDSGGLWTLNSSGATWRVSSDSASAVAFFPNSHDAVVADNVLQSSFLLMDAGGTGTQVPLISGRFSSVSISEDSRRVFLAGGDSDAIAIVDLNTRQMTSVSCGCRPTGLSPLKGTSVFRLTDFSPRRGLSMMRSTKVSADPVTVLDASSSEPRVFVIPPGASIAAEVK
jgi:hypothetical protein